MKLIPSSKFKFDTLNLKKATYFCIVIAALFAYNHLYAYAYFPLTEGWFIAYAKLLGEGKQLYVDLNLYLTPGYVFLTKLIGNSFGWSIFVFRTIGILISTLIGVLLYKINSSVFSEKVAVLPSIVCAVFYYSGNAFINYDFTQVYTLLALIVIFLSLSLLKSDRYSQLTASMLGLVSALCFLVKQSNGMFVDIGSFLFTLSFGFYHRKAGGFKVFVWYILFLLLPTMILLAWLSYNNATGIFFEQVFSSAIEVKGSAKNILSSWLTGVFNKTLYLQITSLLIIGAKFLVIGTIVCGILKHLKILSYVSNFVFMGILLLCIFLITQFVSESNMLVYIGDEFKENSQQILNHVLPTVLLYFVLVLFFHFFRWVRNSQPNIILLTVIFYCSILIIANGTSAGITEISLFLPFALLMCHIQSISFIRPAGMVVVALVSTLFVAFLYTKKINYPYKWWGADVGPLNQSVYQIDTPLFNGIKMNQHVHDVIKFAYDVTSEFPNDTLFAFPHIPIFYILSDRWPDSPNVVSWFDFMPDSKAIQESEILLASKPQLIIYYELPDTAWIAHSNLFRAGKQLGQTAIKNTIENFIATKQYTEIKRFEMDSESRIIFLKKVSR